MKEKSNLFGIQMQPLTDEDLLFATSNLEEKDRINPNENPINATKQIRTEFSYFMNDDTR